MPNTLKPMGQLPLKHQLFIVGCLIHKGDKTKAARHAGYSARTAKEQGYQLFTKLHHYIDPQTRDLVRGHALEAEQVVQGLSLIASSDIRDFMDWDDKRRVRMVAAEQLTPEQAYCVSEIVQTQTKEGRSVRVKLCDKQAALESLAKYHNLFRRTVGTKGLWVSFEDGTVHGDGKTKRELTKLTQSVEVTFEDADVPIQNGHGKPRDCCSARATRLTRSCTRPAGS